MGHVLNFGDGSSHPLPPHNYSGGACWCGLSHTSANGLTGSWIWPSTTYTTPYSVPAPEFSDNGYIGKHRH